MRIFIEIILVIAFFLTGFWIGFNAGCYYCGMVVVGMLKKGQLTASNYFHKKGMDFRK